MDAILERLQTTSAEILPQIIQAFLILVVGWLLALALSTIARSIISRFDLQRYLASDKDDEPSFNIADLVGKLVYWGILLFAIVGVLDALQLSGIATPIRNFLDQVIGFLPSLIGGAILAAVAWVVATLVRRLIAAAFNATDWDERLTSSAQMEQTVPLGDSLGTLVYWLIWLLFLPAILDALQLDGILAPVQGMVNEVLAFLPNLFSAGVILVVGYFVARIIRDIVTNLLASTGLDALVGRVSNSLDVSSSPRRGRNASPPLSLSRLAGTLVFALILIPVVISALDALKLEALSQPAILMLTEVLNAIPAIFAAAILLVIAYFVARLIADLIGSILSALGFDNIFSRLGLQNPTTDSSPPSKIVGTIILVAIMLFATAEAANLLGFLSLSALIAEFIVFFGNVLLGLVVLGLGLYFANLAAETIRSSAVQNAGTLANFARYSIIILTVAMALRQMGIAEDIVTLAFGLLLGAIAIAVAIAFGLGGREIAAYELDKMLQNWRDQPKG